MTKTIHANRPAILLFMRRPQPGRVKTRLAASIGADAAYRVYCRLLMRTLGLVADFQRDHPALEVFLFVTPRGDTETLASRFPGPWKWFAQSEGHLGRRMEQAFLHAWKMKRDAAVLVGTDIADLTPDDLQAAFASLEDHDAVLGPSADGGFYLIGLKPGRCSALRPDQWSTPRVLERTLGLLRRDGRHISTLPRRHDIDIEEDLRHYNADPFLHSRVSVIIPTLSPPDRLAPVLQRLATRLWPGDEIIVVRGRQGPAPAPAATTPRRVGPAPERITCRQIDSQRGRGLQLAAGARLAQGDIFCFAHDDSVPPPHWAYQLRKIMLYPDATLGCFLLAFHSATRSLRWIAHWANFRTRRLHLPYGDQLLFCRRDTYRRIGGMPPLMLMEDIAFVCKALKKGRLLVIPETVETSPARYQQRGVLRASLENHMLSLLYRLGAADTSLHHFYYRHHARTSRQVAPENRSLCQNKHIYKGL